MCSTATLSPIVIASVWSWVTYKVATPTRRLDAGDLRAHLDAQLGIEVGERLVHQNTDGSRTMARPMATRWRWPPESWPGLELR